MAGAGSKGPPGSQYCPKHSEQTHFNPDGDGAAIITTKYQANTPLSCFCFVAMEGKVSACSWLFQLPVSLTWFLLMYPTHFSYWATDIWLVRAVVQVELILAFVCQLWFSSGFGLRRLLDVCGLFEFYMVGWVTKSNIMHDENLKPWDLMKIFSSMSFIDSNSMMRKKFFVSKWKLKKDLGFFWLAEFIAILSRFIFHIWQASFFIR